MSQTHAFRRTGDAQEKPRGEISSDAAFAMMDPRDQLAGLLRRSIGDKPFSELSDVLYGHQGASIVGHVLLDTLEDRGFSVDDFDAVGALTAAAVPLVHALIHAAASRGEDVDGFVMDFVYPSVKGPSIAGKRVVLLDAWLSEKSYVQTSSLVTLRNGNELSLDFGIIEREGASVVAVASLIGGTDMATSTLDVVNPISAEHHELTFIEVYGEGELRSHA